MANYKELKDVCVKITDGSHFSPKTVPEGYPYITVRDIEGDKIDFERCKFIGEKSYLELERNGCRPLNGDVLFSKDGTVGKVSLIDYEKKFVVLSSLAIIRPNPEIVGAAYLKHQLTTPEVLKKATGRKTGAAIRRIVLKNLKTIPIPVPPLLEQDRIVGILDEAFEGIAAATAQAEKNLHNARELFQSVLQSTFSQKGDDWVETTLGDESLLQIVDGDRGVNYPKKADFLDEGHCLFLNTKNVRPDGFNFDTRMFINEVRDRKLRKGKLERNDVILTTRGTLGNVAWYSDDVGFDHIRINSGMLIFRPKPNKVRSRYLFEILQSNIFQSQIKAHSTGAAQPQLPIKILENFTIPVPSSLEEQDEIVNHLNDLAIETKALEAIYERKQSALAELKQSLLQKAFAGEL